MTQPVDPLHWKIKDLEALRKGVDVDTPLSREFLAAALLDSNTSVDLDQSAVVAKAHLDFQHDCVLCRGSLLGELSLQCQRCLAPAKVPVQASLNMTFVPAGGALPVRHDEGSFDPSDPDDVDYAHHDRETVDLRPVVREYLLLSLPITVLCQEECRGLCPSCGIDLNTSTCTCQQRVPLSPFSALAKLKI